MNTHSLPTSRSWQHAKLCLLCWRGAKGRLQGNIVSLVSIAGWEQSLSALGKSNSTERQRLCWPLTSETASQCKCIAACMTYIVSSPKQNPFWACFPHYSQCRSWLHLDFYWVKALPNVTSFWQQESSSRRCLRLQIKGFNLAQSSNSHQIPLLFSMVSLSAWKPRHGQQALIEAFHILMQKFLSYALRSLLRST